MGNMSLALKDIFIFLTGRRLLASMATRVLDVIQLLCLVDMKMTWIMVKVLLSLDQVDTFVINLIFRAVHIGEYLG